MARTRPATPADAATIATQRVRMFVDSGQSADDLAPMHANFIAWVTPRLANDTYLGWLVEEADEVIAGAGVWLQDFPPHFLDPQPCRAYLLNFYVSPAHRGQGHAVALLRQSLAEARRRNIRIATLHASKFGRPIYEREGFTPTNEMLMKL